jgi:CHAD domain-containing protein
MPTEIRETERKYEFEPGAVLPSLQDLPGVAGESALAEQKLTAEYFDTAGLRLIGNGVTLRRRRGGKDPGWHLKLPRGGDSRLEIQLPLGRRRQVPAELASLVRAYARGEARQPVALITTTRRGSALLDDAGESLAEVTIDDVSAQSMGESTTLTRWREVEVELTGGGPGLLEAVGQRLRRGGLRPAGNSSKLQRALAGQLPAPEPEPRLTPRSAAGDVVLAYARSQAAAVQSLDPMVRRAEPDSVHDMRVATRRLRSILKAAAKTLGLPDAGRLRAELKWLGGVLGEARDNEVLASYLQARLAETDVEQLLGPVQARVTAYFAPRAASARAALLEALDSERYLALLNDLDQALSGPLRGTKARQPAADVLPHMVRQARRRVRRRARRATRAPAGKPREAALHETRKAAKDARYTAEAASLAGRKKDRKLAKRMKKLQSMLGDHHDAVVARDTARDIGVRAYQAGENAFAFGILYERCQRDASSLEEQTRAKWARVFGPADGRWGH